MRELASPDELLKVRDHASIITLPPDGWYCAYCPSPENDVHGTVDWIQGPRGEYGRCRECGQKYDLMSAVEDND